MSKLILYVEDLTLLMSAFLEFLSIIDLKLITD